MQSLLLDPKTEGYPRDFILARLRGRRGQWGDSAGIHQRKLDDPWLAMQAELCWLYKTMDRKTRQEFGLCFLYFELRRLLIGLRRLAGRSREGLEKLAAHSLLNRALVRRLQTASEVAEAARMLDTVLAQDLHTAPLLEPILTGQGHRQMEERLIDSFFAYAMTRRLKPAVIYYFGHLIDLRNLLSILKTRRWKLSEPQPLLAGGTETPEKWQSLQRPGQELQLRKTIGRISSSEEFDAESVEHALLNRIQRRLHCQARAAPEPFLILDYLWANYLRARNLGLQHWAGDTLAEWEKLG